MRCLWVALIVCLAFRTPLFACACCADPGLVRETILDKPSLDGPETELTLTGSLGRSNEEEGDTSRLFSASGVFEDRHFVFSLKSEKGAAATILFQPEREERSDRSADMMGLDNGEGEPRVYKEIRITGTVTADPSTWTRMGFRAPSEALLILMGNGNACTNATDFHQWTLMLRPEDSSTTWWSAGGGQTAEVSAHDRARVENSAGMRSYTAKDFPGAVAHFQRAAQQDPTFLLAFTNLACAWSLLRHPTQAIDALKKAAAIDGPATRAKMAKDKDFDGIRSLPEFRALLNEPDRSSAEPADRH